MDDPAVQAAREWIEAMDISNLAPLTPMEDTLSTHVRALLTAYEAKEEECKPRPVAVADIIYRVEGKQGDYSTYWAVHDIDSLEVLGESVNLHHAIRVAQAKAGGSTP